MRTATKVLMLAALGVMCLNLYEAYAQATAAHYPGSAYYTDCAATSPHDHDIGWITEYGVCGGYGDGTFGPQAVVSREQMATFMMRQSVMDATATIFIVDEMYFDGWYFGDYAYSQGWITAEQYAANQAFTDWLAALFEYQAAHMTAAAALEGGPIDGTMVGAISRALSVSAPTQSCEPAR